MTAEAKPLDPSTAVFGAARYENHPAIMAVLDVIQLHCSEKFEGGYESVDADKAIILLNTVIASILTGLPDDPEGRTPRANIITSALQHYVENLVHQTREKFEASLEPQPVQ